jgi:phospholipid/cholesterol/gamma-HCH transport system substrate-binding protein
VAGALVSASVVATTAGCGFHGLYSTNLPGSVGGPFSNAKTYDVTAYFYTDGSDDGGSDGVLDLVPQSAVRANDVTVGTVENITLVQRRDPADGGALVYAAKVDMKVKTSVVLPKNAVAILDETSLLGEKYVELQRPAAPTVSDMSQTLAQTHVIEDDGTSTYPGVEEVFGLLSAVLNGGDLAKLQTINTELSAALAGRESQVHDVLIQLNTFVGGLNDVRTQINGAIDELDTLSTELNREDSTIATALDDLGPGITVLANERAQLVSLLQGLANLGVISNRVVNESLSATEKDLALLEPTLTQLNKAGTALPAALDLIPDFPFARNSVNGIKGDGNNLVLDVNATGVLNTLESGLCTTAGLPAAVQSACTSLTSVVKGLGLTGSSANPLGDVTRSVTSLPLADLLKDGAE